ncbi:FAD-dependent oxidoreductase [Pseudomonas typographi]|uniref:FAD-binding oxidoreductase n=1 Tax=Pseudomonas typographi TaxID=2715964 RepID=A0ABR7Z220_9PSED|nr:FAD-binding oxidoreductase [Pseudomonas typographi]MBD1587456.1 FAD-binding oxidoreductase [Pseudomonas typographi]MBD1599462.1 FAD-binding oxidoreductase [Pseudomonas typographi]
MEQAEIVIVGGGLMGAALAWALAGLGHDVLVLDGGDLDPRASRANLGLVWVSDKGVGQPDYAILSRDAALHWPAFAAVIQEETGIDLQLQQPGGFNFALSEQELEQLTANMATIADQTHGELCSYEILDREEVRVRLPHIGPGVVGASFCPYDGHVNSLRLFNALHLAMTKRGVDYRPQRPVELIEPTDDGFTVSGAWGAVRARKIILAAGLGNTRLAPMVGLYAPLVRSKGQVIVTEKCRPFFPSVSGALRQTGEGSVLIGESQETHTGSLAVNHSISAVLAERAARVFPVIADLNVVRIWTGFRVKTPDGMPIYQQSETHPGAFVMLCHSGVTLTALHALEIAPQISAGVLQPRLQPFHARRLHVS